ncbi:MULTISPECIES: TIGR03364 family FAD-dependent oxidoreductase [Mycobacteroides]|jgi:FAD dependent oxidoreductase TIGR03364|uniref:FAD-dependent oxidoreductase n=1 Tax=Mycobacteroides chelonae TaxID=1774 RepID=A0A1S1LQ70_MYCCH|nr:MULTISPECIES: TIGR03364 family FAD-dependent oxidoreductase [Mycobacteroides]KRQ27065.1 FAD-dependent oxidoreductase [Mycobacteroides sp. H003]KRQ33099.1 FAD-dependent oxidoreductase [Mycobacteroides sp. H101]KRQ33352.1 FAD-dependent oxidoreductase [Mycobacteroides sp. H092]KRQ51201.1 FAD-dependent oxidoreductase [Mycobacteroides sp. H063]KRQ56803.1 FAD-dependent oxidoreductase [Mycobacteroides sp. HXVII]
MRVVVVGGGILGTAHAWAAIERGHHVVQLERESEARGATVRNFGLVWVSGRSPRELEVAQRSRDLWQGIAKSVPGTGFRAIGSLTLLQTQEEVAVAEEVMARSDAGARGFTLLDPEAVQRRNPALRGKFLAGLHCARDGAVESRVALPAMRLHLKETGRYSFRPGAEARSVDATSDGVSVRADDGEVYRADAVVMCAGAAHGGLVRELLGDFPVRRVRLQMMQTASLGEELTTAIADGDSLRYYPAFAGDALDALNAVQLQEPTAAEYKMQLLCVQRLHGGLTIGDTHEYTEPFAFDVDEAPYRHLINRAEELLGRKLPPVVRRWAGVYSQCADPNEIVYRREAAPGVWVVTGPGGRGMTLGPAIGADTADLMNL